MSPRSPSLSTTVTNGKAPILQSAVNFIRNHRIPPEYLLEITVVDGQEFTAYTRKVNQLSDAFISEIPLKKHQKVVITAYAEDTWKTL